MELSRERMGETHTPEPRQWGHLSLNILVKTTTTQC